MKIGAVILIVEAGAGWYLEVCVQVWAVRLDDLKWRECSANAEMRSVRGADMAIE